MLTPAKYLDQDEQTQLEAICEDFRKRSPRDTTMILLMLRTGARPQELLNLTWSDIYWKENKVFIKTMKGGRDRIVFVGNDILARLRALGQGKPEDRLFDIKYRMFHVIWGRYRPVKKKLHCLRHTFAVNLYRKSGYNLRLVQKALGHKNMPTTAVYLEIEMNEAELRQALLD